MESVENISRDILLGLAWKIFQHKQPAMFRNDTAKCKSSIFKQ